MIYERMAYGNYNWIHFTSNIVGYLLNYSMCEWNTFCTVLVFIHRTRTHFFSMKDKTVSDLPITAEGQSVKNDKQKLKNLCQ